MPPRRVVGRRRCERLLKSIAAQREELVFPAAISSGRRAARNSRLKVQHSFSAQTNLCFTLAYERALHKRVSASFGPGVSLVLTPGNFRERIGIGECE